ncbi:MlaD family protein [Thermomonospora catenispora]|uniref:MlaD family protein n=1 Tax=Thermomonospora catenispora TaxID=2493090 RepID=UPI00111FD346|nr:MCE family protein [Thermomonospora catenispora]TNY38374.1 MCE family protein [Thermomonospora catenispora]
MSEDHLSLRSRLLYGAIGVAVLAGGAAYALAGVHPDRDGARYYHAVFGRAGQGLDDRSEVKIRGITVGGVESVALRPDGRVRVRFRIDDRDVRITRDAVASIEPVSVFGPKDLAVDLGATAEKGPFLEEGGTVARTEDPEEPADAAWPAYRLTGALDPQDLSALLHTFSEGLRGQGPALRRSIDNGARLLEVMHDRRAELRRLVDDVAALSQTFGGRGGTVTGLAEDFTAVSGVIGDRPDKVERLLKQAERLSEQLSGTLARHGDDIAELIDVGSRAVEVLHREQNEIPTLIDGLNGFFSLLSDIIRVPGPENSLLAQVVAYLPTDVCKIFVDACESDDDRTYLRLPGGPR